MEGAPQALTGPLAAVIRGELTSRWSPVHANLLLSVDSAIAEC